MILQGYGVRIDLIGDTFISKAGITSSTFNQVPDVPVSSFELYLPQGRDSALAANGNLCKSALKMPTSFIAQNGATIHQATPITVTGVHSKASKAKKAQKAKAARKRHKHRSQDPSSHPSQHCQQEEQAMTRAIGRALATVGVTASVFAVFAAPSLAHFVYASGSTSTFGSEGSGAGQFKRPQGVAIDEATEDVYVVDEGDNRVERFEADGKYLSEIDGSETPAKAFASPRFVAVDNSGGVEKGRVYVADPSQNVVDVFDSSGKYLFQIDVPELLDIATDSQGHLWTCTGPAFEEYSEAGTLMHRQPVIFDCSGVVVDSNGDVYDVEEPAGRIIRYSPPDYIGNNEAHLGEGEGARRIAINTATNNIFQDSSFDGIVEWPPFGQAAGTELWSRIEEEFSVGLKGVGGLAVKAKDGLLYASDELSGDVKVFTPIVVPDATTGSAQVK